MELVKHLGLTGPHGVIPDRRTTENSNVGLTELPMGRYTPVDPKENLQETTPTAKLVVMGTQFIQDYPNIVRDQRLDVRWDKVKYWGKR